MKLIFFNPNSTTAMTDSIVAVAQTAVPKVEVMGWTNTAGPPAIQGPEDGAAATPGLLARLPELSDVHADAVIIACFDDTGLTEMREKAPCPVIGIGQASFHMAALYGPGFAVMTTLEVSVPVISTNLNASGLGVQSQGVFASGVPVLAVEDGSEQVMGQLCAKIDEIAAGGATSIILGCAGMARHLPRLQIHSPVPLIDPVRAAAHMAAALGSMAAA